MVAHLSSHYFSWHLKNKPRKFIALVIITVVSISFVGYVCWSLVVSFSNITSFRDKLQKDGFRIIPASSRIVPSFMFLPPEITIVCQNQTQFIYEARLVNSTGWGADVYLLDGVHFYAITIDNRTSEPLGYEYGPPLPSPLNAVIIYWISPS
jgi:hypothetical protein